MRIQTKEYNVYNYQDVLNNPELKDKILQKYAYINVEDIDWYEWTLEDWNKKTN